MSAATILKLCVGDRIRRNIGPPGAVTGFRIDKVAIRWDGASMDQGYTDGELMALEAAQRIPLDGPGSHKFDLAELRLAQEQNEKLREVFEIARAYMDGTASVGENCPCNSCRLVKAIKAVEASDEAVEAKANAV